MNPNAQRPISIRTPPSRRGDARMWRKRAIGAAEAQSAISTRLGLRRQTISFYSGWLFPRVLDLIMRQQQIIPFRQHIGDAASGRVLDLGIGSGLNLPFYGERADCVVGVDPSLELLRFAGQRA